MTIAAQLIILMIIASALWIYFGHDIWKYGSDDLEIPCDECPNYGGSIEVCIFECVRYKR